MKLLPAVRRATWEVVLPLGAALIALGVDATDDGIHAPVGLPAVLVPALVLGFVLWTALPPSRRLPGVLAHLHPPPEDAAVDRRSLRLVHPRWWIFVVVPGPVLALVFDGSGPTFAAAALGVSLLAQRKRAVMRQWQRDHHVELLADEDRLYAAPLASRA